MYKTQTRLHKPSHLDKMLLTNPSPQVPLKCTCRSKGVVCVGVQTSVNLLDGNKQSVPLKSDKYAVKYFFYVNNCNQK